MCNNEGNDALLSENKEIRIKDGTYVNSIMRDMMSVLPEGALDEEPDEELAISCIMQIWAEPKKSALPICNYSQILYQFLTFTQKLKRSRIYFYTINKEAHL